MKKSVYPVRKFVPIAIGSLDVIVFSSKGVTVPVVTRTGNECTQEIYHKFSQIVIGRTECLMEFEK